MNKNVIHMGLDVDDVHYQKAALYRETGEVLNFRCRPTLKGLLSRLRKVQNALGRYELRVYYEASYIGFCLQRDLGKSGIARALVAPTSIPSPRGKAAKTDRLDASDLVEFYANGLLSEVSAPGPIALASAARQQGDLRRHL